MPGLGDQRQPGHARRLQRQAAGHQRPLADPVGQRPGDRRDRDERRRPRQQPQPGFQRAVAEHRLEQLGEEEHRAEQRREGEEDRRVARPRTRASGRSRAGSSARGRARSHATNAIASSDAGGQRADHLDAAPARLVAAHEAPDEPEGRAGDEREARDVEARRPARGSRASRLSTSGIADEPDRHVEPEDPLPVDALDDGAADERAAGDREPGDRAEDADRRAALRGRERRAAAARGRAA